MKKYLLYLSLFLSTSSLANDYELAHCPTELTPQSNGTYVSHEFPGWKSSWYRNKITPPLTGKNFSHTWIAYDTGTTYQVYCLYHLGTNGLSMRMIMNQPVNDIEQVYPQNWKNGSCFQEGENGIEACAFKIVV